MRILRDLCGKEKWCPLSESRISRIEESVTSGNLLRRQFLFYYYVLCLRSCQH